MLRPAAALRAVGERRDHRHKQRRLVCCLRLRSHRSPYAGRPAGAAEPLTSFRL